MNTGFGVKRPRLEPYLIHWGRLRGHGHQLRLFICWIVTPSKFKCLVPNPVPFNVPVLRDTVFKEIIKSKWGHSVALIQSRCPCNKRKLRHRQIQNENTQGADHLLRDKGKPQKSTCWPLNLGLAASRTERKQISICATQPAPLCYRSPINRPTS